MLLYRDRFPAFDTLYIGGGTPTVLEDAQLRQLFHMLYSSLDVAEDSEITVEANPNDVTAEKLGNAEGVRSKPRQPGSPVLR